jgi:preprotein translocase subunit SecG
MIFLFYFLLTLFLLMALLLCFVILIQEAKSLGLGASFGGDSGDSLFGTSTAQVLKRFTGYLAAVFLAVSFLLSVWSASMGGQKGPSVPVSAEEYGP